MLNSSSNKTIHSSTTLDMIINHKPTILIFIPNTNEVQRFITTNAFKQLENYYHLHYVLPKADYEKMLASSFGQLSKQNTSALHIKQERFLLWSNLFESACIYYAEKSPSFKIRANLSFSKSSIIIMKVIPTFFFNKLNKLFFQFSNKHYRWKNFNLLFSAIYRRLNNIIKYKSKYANYLTERERIHKEYRPLPGISDLIQKYTPLFCIVPTSLLDLFCNDVVWACSSHNIPCLLLQSGWDNLSSKGVIHSSTPYLGCWGPQSRYHAMRIQGLKKTKLFDLGAPHYKYLKPSNSAEISSLRNKLKVKKDTKLILFGGSFRQFDETSVLQFLDKHLEQNKLNNIQIIYRPHPWRAHRMHEENFYSLEWKNIIFDPDMKARYVTAQHDEGYIKRELPMFDMQYVSQLLSIVDAVISPMSTLLIESLIMRKPTLALAFSDGKHKHNPSVTSKMTHFIDAKRLSPIIWCYHKKQLIKKLSIIINNNQIEESDASAFLRHVVTLSPKTYSERLAEFCKYSLEKEARKMRAISSVKKRGSISNAYGANEIINAYCNLNDNHLKLPNYWMHGWIPSYHNIHPALIALHKKVGQSHNHDYQAQIHMDKQHVPQWVGRIDQANYLKANGYTKVKAIGHPIIYSDAYHIKRIPNSLLVLPPHGHKTHGPKDKIANKYALQISQLKRFFSMIYVGVCEDDFARNQWIQSFSKYDIPCFVTTDQSDTNTLLKLRQILSSFEYVTTNGYGSHIAISAYCGAKISVYGEFAEFPFNEIRKTHAVKMFPELATEAHYLCTEKALRDNYPFLFVEPHKAVTQKKWGDLELGEANRLSPVDIKKEFFIEQKNLEAYSYS